MSLRFEAIHPAPFIAIAFQFEMVQTMERLMGGILVDFLKTTATWEEQPTFEQEMAVDDFDIKGHVFCDALRDGDRIRGTKMTGPLPAPINLVYYFLNEGTTVRYATMSPDFVPKTQVRVIGSFPGQGSVQSVSVRRPRAGIKARKWDEEIAKKYERILLSQLRSALIRGVRQSGHAFMK